jgi:ribosomal protein S18 acetylase RimI-like enzyme
MIYKIEPISDVYRPFVDRQIAESWAGPYVVSLGEIHDTRDDLGFVAVEGDSVLGYALYRFMENECELTVLESLRENIGVGSALINAVMSAAKEAGCRRVWLVTTNDNTHAIRFYQKFGFVLRKVHINSMAEARKLKPQIPPTGNDGIPIEHEFEFEIMVS